MAKEVDLLSYWMPVLRQLKEFKEIAKAEEPELRYLLEACESTLKNFSIITADEYGISRFESLLGIIPAVGSDLETRRLIVLTKWNSREVYTDEWLYNKLLSLCGSKDLFNIDSHNEEYSLDITIKLGVREVLEVITTLLSEVLPCNLACTIHHRLEEKDISTPYMGIAVSTAMSYQIANREDASPQTAVLGSAVVGTMVLGTN